MKKLVQSLVAVAVALGVLKMALAGPIQPGPEVKLMSKGKVIKKVPLHDGLNVVKHPDGHQLKAWVQKGKVVRAQVFDASGRMVATQAAAKPATVGRLLCICIAIFCINCS